MQDLAGLAAALASLREPAVLATLTRVRGRFYRKPGARMLMEAGGRQTGVLSAGCLEADLQARQEQVLATGRPDLVSFDLGSDLDLLWGTGMGCKGWSEVLLEPVLPAAAHPWLDLCLDLLAHRRSGALATVLAVRGEAPARVGDRYLLDPGGPGLPPPQGPFGALVQAQLAQSHAAGRAFGTTLAWEGAEVDLMLEPLQPPVALWVWGAGDHVRPLARQARELGWTLGILDHRPALATPGRFPEADRVVVGRAPACLEALSFDARTAALVVSHVYDHDLRAVAFLARQPLGYLGLQGNRQRCARILEEVQAGDGPLTPDQLARIHAPAGLDLGGDGPETIALSMVAEIQAVLAGHAGGSLRDRPGRIHPAVPA